MENMSLWDQAFMTDPAAVKPITGKSYSGNSPKPFWLIERATKILGPCGIGWGVEVVKESFQQVSPDDWLHQAVVRVWYEWEGKRGHVEQMGGTKAAYRTGSGKILVDEDAGKKSVTDAMVKCLSMLGFAGDIFSGRWDDSKYQSEVKEHFAEEKQIDNKQAIHDEIGGLVIAILKATDIASMTRAYNMAKRAASKYPALNDELMKSINGAGKQRKGELTQGAAA